MATKKNIHKRFREFVRRQGLVAPGQRVLLAVSGGVDSVVMAHLFSLLEVPFGIAHCNFQLRGDDAEGDEVFVKELADELQVPFHIKRFDTKTYAEEHRLSIQMAARELRYTFFRELMQQQKGYHLLATAHHKDDSVETILLNMVKGAVLSGLHGILPKSGDIIRPLLWAEKMEIETYAEERGIAWRMDISNEEDKYQRNLLRNQVIPLLKQINPSIAHTMQQAAEVRYEIEKQFLEKCSQLWEQYAELRDGKTAIPLELIRNKKIDRPVLLEWLQPYGFNLEHCTGIMDSAGSTESRQWESGTHILFKDRNTLWLMPQESAAGQQSEAWIEEAEGAYHFNGIAFKAELLREINEEELKDPAMAFLDADKLNFPLKVRYWQPADAFIPFGMKGRKKVSDYLTDIKVSLPEKKGQMVILSGDDIVWLVGRRIDDRYRLAPGASRIVKLSFERE